MTNSNPKTKLIFVFLAALTLSACNKSVADYRADERQNMKWMDRDIAKLQDRIDALEERVKKIEEPR